MNPPFQERRRRLLDQLVEHKLPGLAVSHLPNVRYLCGFTGSNGLLVVTHSRTVLYTDPRYTLQADEETDCAVRIVRGSLWDAVAPVRGLGFESDKLTHAAWMAASKIMPLKPVCGLVERLRMVKSEDEIRQIQDSVQVAAKAYARSLRAFRPGMTEKDLAAEIDHQVRKAGAEGPAFETIVAAGPRSALPHAKPTSQSIRTNQILLIDMGASLNGYASDMTRVVHTGTPGRKARSLYNAVLEAQLAAIDCIRPGIRAAQVDAVARRVLKEHHLDKAFQHSTGHGLGLEIHENPRLGKKDETPLESGMVVTVEPGAYLEGFGGVRIEDTVLVTKTGVEVLTPAAKELLAL
ncbi:MAG: aminopeptidase P family protein [Bryobacterales bacterium]|nr:aminopeptidase P family protein [Bryobacterales bacterium]